ncbi:response regulator transcription factor (plasmid) [Paraburkholderia sp. D15]|uniref:response regulator transcription factor n=1 Tax=Paraburkholderia sp. D15 TaxID=2880218 RepID=UPI0024787A35|nr:response regulator transcription factor [Paraburkholderia sp. D15]WGS54889.1 response regulator transcription factor [Paraburkholderia sp. D15]
MKPHILVVHDDPDCRDALRACLQPNGFDVAVLYGPSKLLERLGVELPATIVMKAGDFVGGELAALRALREANYDVPVVMLGGQDDGPQRVRALASGADDIVSFPHNPLELLVKIRRVIARAYPDPLQNPGNRPPFHFGRFELCFVSRSLTFSGQQVSLLEAEYAMLNLFASASERVMSREFIAQRIRPDRPLSPTSVGTSGCIGSAAAWRSTPRSQK